MKRLQLWSGAIATAVLCTACQHNTGMSTMSANGTVASPAPANSYDVRIWSGNKKAEIAYPQQRVSTSLKWAESDEGIAAWPSGAMNDKMTDKVVKVDHAHGMLRSVRITMDGTTGEEGPALVVDSVSVASAAGAAHYVCADMKASPAKITPGASDDLSCRKE
jgi:hypothetical protein